MSLCDSARNTQVKALSTYSVLNLARTENQRSNTKARRWLARVPYCGVRMQCKLTRQTLSLLVTLIIKRT